jgi:hypothetical protein
MVRIGCTIHHIVWTDCYTGIKALVEITPLSVMEYKLAPDQLVLCGFINLMSETDS